MASLVLRRVARVGDICFGSHTKYIMLYLLLFDIQNVEKFRCDNYLARSAFNLLSHVVGVVTQLGEHCDFFWLKWEDVRHHTCASVISIRYKMIYECTVVAGKIVVGVVPQFYR